ncbi:hypothetical protein BCY84_19562 [Trypanosoma cruzi cruzi]|nr:hypothetical protein BCY84_19562 [Trypanosoma cruzi cruzi]
MTFLSACVLFLVGVFFTPFCARAAAISTNSCPTDCDNAASWCHEVFYRGGSVSSGDCGNYSFECTCNNASAIVVKRNEGVCTWEGSFDTGEPEGNYCFKYTALCPTNCSNIDLWASQCANDVVCEESKNEYHFNCTTCEGRAYSIVGNGISCKKQFSSKNHNCDPLITCNGHGCCRKTDDPLNDSLASASKTPNGGIGPHQRVPTAMMTTILAEATAQDHVRVFRRSSLRLVPRGPWCFLTWRYFFCLLYLE